MVASSSRQRGKAENEFEMEGDGEDDSAKEKDTDEEEEKSAMPPQIVENTQQKVDRWLYENIGIAPRKVTFGPPQIQLFLCTAEDVEFRRQMTYHPTNNVYEGEESSESGSDETTKNTDENSVTGMQSSMLGRLRQLKSEFTMVELDYFPELFTNPEEEENKDEYDDDIDKPIESDNINGLMDSVEGLSSELEKKPTGEQHDKGPDDTLANGDSSVEEIDTDNEDMEEWKEEKKEESGQLEVENHHSIDARSPTLDTNNVDKKIDDYPTFQDIASGWEDEKDGPKTKEGDEKKEEKNDDEKKEEHDDEKDTRKDEPEKEKEELKKEMAEKAEENNEVSKRNPYDKPLDAGNTQNESVLKKTKEESAKDIKPKAIPMTKKEEMVKKGALKVKKGDYPTFQDIASDWDDEKDGPKTKEGDEKKEEENDDEKKEEHDDEKEAKDDDKKEEKDEPEKEKEELKKEAESKKEQEVPKKNMDGIKEQEKKVLFLMMKGSHLRVRDKPLPSQQERGIRAEQQQQLRKRGDHNAFLQRITIESSNTPPLTPPRPEIPRWHPANKSSPDGSPHGEYSFVTCPSPYAKNEMGPTDVELTLDMFKDIQQMKPVLNEAGHENTGITEENVNLVSSSEDLLTEDMFKDIQPDTQVLKEPEGEKKGNTESDEADNMNFSSSSKEVRTEDMFKTMEYDTDDNMGEENGQEDMDVSLQFTSDNSSLKEEEHQIMLPQKTGGLLKQGCGRWQRDDEDSATDDELATDNNSHRSNNQTSDTVSRMEDYEPDVSVDLENSGAGDSEAEDENGDEDSGHDEKLAEERDVDARQPPNENAADGLDDASEGVITAEEYDTDSSESEELSDDETLGTAVEPDVDQEARFQMELNGRIQEDAERIDHNRSCRPLVGTTPEVKGIAYLVKLEFHKKLNPDLKKQWLPIPNGLLCGQPYSQKRRQLGRKIQTVRGYGTIFNLGIAVIHAPYHRISGLMDHDSHALVQADSQETTALKLISAVNCRRCLETEHGIPYANNLIVLLNQIGSIPPADPFNII